MERAVMSAQVACARPGSTGLAQLAILAASTVDAREDSAAVAGRLAADAGARSRQGAAPPLRNLTPPFNAMFAALAAGHPSPRVEDAVGDRIFYLIQDCTFVSPSRSHMLSSLPLGGEIATAPYHVGFAGRIPARPSTASSPTELRR